jgi:regulatory protein
MQIYLNGEYAFSVSHTAAASLEIGASLDKTRIAEFKQADEVYRACRQALRYLGFRPRSCKEIEIYLNSKGYTLQAVQGAVERLRRQKYLDDLEFARFWVENRKSFQPRSSFALRYELRQKGIDDEVITAVLSGTSDDELAWLAAKGKIQNWRKLQKENFQKKVLSFLSRRGFNYEVSKSACNRVWSDLHSDDKVSQWNNAASKKRR